MAKKIATIQFVRRVTLGVSLAGLTALTVIHQRNAAFPSVDALDPFGGLETLMKFVAGGEFLKKLEPGNIVLFGAVLVLGVVLSRFFCGWFCAFGALQGLFGSLGKKIFRRRLAIPPKVDAVLRWVKYPLLAAIVFFTWRAGTLVIRPYDPLAAYGHLAAGLPALWSEFRVGLIVLVAILLASMVNERFFCKYLCPLGAFNAILSRVPIFRIRREASTCISCSKCDRACPMGVDVSGPEKVDSPECIACMECVTACPTKKDTLKPGLMGKAVKAGVVVAVGLGIYLAAALAGQALGMLKFSAPSLESRAKAGDLKVEDIKGSSTWKSVADGFGIDLGRLFAEAGVDAAKVPPEAMLKDTGKLMGIEFEADAARIAVAKILGVPYAGENGEAAPAAKEAAPVEKETAPAAKDARPAVKAVAPAAAPTAPADFALEGTMSVNDVVKTLGWSAAQVREKLGLPSDVPLDTPLRDMKDQYGYTMPELKERIKK